ncbi:unnamed protein product [Schistosoma mattheei]|uniref:Uncharacterized protein n=1 Tax=Schistosoma mattheei TaxID=31246 RepID=A0A183NQP0_9TREM|nr:unnamed protein product [Schistosoma mattheei]
MEKTTNVAETSEVVSLNIHNGKSKILRYNTACTNPITIDGENLEDVKTFIYLGSIIDEHDGSDSDLKSKSSIFTIEEHLERKTTVRQPTPGSEFSIQMSRQFYCMWWKHGELQKPSSTRYR